MSDNGMIHEAAKYSSEKQFDSPRGPMSAREFCDYYYNLQAEVADAGGWVADHASDYEEAKAYYQAKSRAAGIAEAKKLLEAYAKEHPTPAQEPST